MSKKITSRPPPFGHSDKSEDTLLSTPRLSLYLMYYRGKKNVPTDTEFWKYAEQFRQYYWFIFRLLQSYISNESSEDLQTKSKKALKNILQKCVYLPALEPLLHDAPANILKHVVAQYSKVKFNLFIFKFFWIAAMTKNDQKFRCFQMIPVPDVSLWPQVAWKRYKRSRLSPVPPFRNTFKRSTPVSPRRSCVIILPAIPRRFCRESRASSPRPTCKPSNNCNNHILTVTYSKYKIHENHSLSHRNIAFYL